MKIYLASSFSLFHELEIVKEHLERNGHEITVMWWDKDFKKIAGTDAEWYRLSGIKYLYQRNLDGIDAADVLILVAPEKKSKKFVGANVEVGYALAKGKKVMSLGRIERSAMHVAIERHTTIDGILESLK